MARPRKRHGKRRGAGRKARGPRASERHKPRPLSVARRQQHRFRIVHISIQHDHVHLICEACDRMALARGVQGFRTGAWQARI